MRFKAKLMNDQLALLHAVVAPISKLQDPHRLAVLYLDEDYVRVSCKTSEQSGITCFAELSQGELFVDHRIESAADNVIVCQVDLVSLRVALQSVLQSRGGGGGGGGNGGSGRPFHPGGRATQQQRRQSAVQALLGGQQHQQAVVLKLAKRNQLPCLCLEGKHGTGRDVEIHQAIPVRIMRRNEMRNHLPPTSTTRPSSWSCLPIGPSDPSSTGSGRWDGTCFWRGPCGET